MGYDTVATGLLQLLKCKPLHHEQNQHVSPGRWHWPCFKWSVVTRARVTAEAELPSLQWRSACSHLGGKLNESPLCPLLSSGSEGSGELRSQQACGYWHHQDCVKHAACPRGGLGPLDATLAQGTLSP